MIFVAVWTNNRKVRWATELCNKRHQTGCRLCKNSGQFMGLEVAAVAQLVTWKDGQPVVMQ